MGTPAPLDFSREEGISDEDTKDVFLKNSE